MKNNNDQILDDVYNLINADENLTPYEWLYNKNQYQIIEAALKSPVLDKECALTKLSKSLFDIYHTRTSRLFELGAPGHVITNECDSYLACGRKLLSLLTNSK